MCPDLPSLCFIPTAAVCFFPNHQRPLFSTKFYTINRMRTLNRHVLTTREKCVTFSYINSYQTITFDISNTMNKLRYSSYADVEKCIQLWCDDLKRSLNVGFKWTPCFEFLNCECLFKFCKNTHTGTLKMNFVLENMKNFYSFKTLDCFILDGGRCET